MHQITKLVDLLNSNLLFPWSGVMLSKYLCRQEELNILRKKSDNYIFLTQLAERVRNRENKHKSCP